MEVDGLMPFKNKSDAYIVNLHNYARWHLQMIASV